MIKIAHKNKIKIINQPIALKWHKGAQMDTKEQKQPTKDTQNSKNNMA